MVFSKATFALCIIFSLSYVIAEVEDLQPLLRSTQDTVEKAKEHVDHMLNLQPLPHQEKLPSLVKNESEHLAYEIKKLATGLHEKINVGEHKPEIKEAVNAAVTHLNEAAASLQHVGSDLKQDNTKYYEAAHKLLQEAKNIISAGPCQEVSPLLKGALHELTHDVNNYQYGIHDVIGPHEGSPHDAGHHAHQHHAKSSEESGESHEKSSSSNHHHHHHH